MQLAFEIPLDWPGPEAVATPALSLVPAATETEEERVWREENREWLEQPVYCFIVTQRNALRYKRVLWKVSRDDAMRLCSDDRTKGPSWMLCWTQNPGTQKDDDWRWIKDTGSMDHVLREFGIRPITGREGKRAAA